MKTRIIRKNASTTQPSFAERGLTTVEYVIILALIAVAGYGIWSKFGKALSKSVNDSETKVFAPPGDNDGSH